jgi:hypothetical protein
VDLDAFDGQHQSAILALRAFLTAYAQQKQQWHQVGLAAKMQGPEDKALHLFLVRVVAMSIFVLPTRAKYATITDVAACEIASRTFAFAVDIGAEIASCAYQHIALLSPCLGALNVLLGWLQQHSLFLRPPYNAPMVRLRAALAPLLSGLSNFVPTNTTSQQRDELVSSSWLSEDQELQGFEPNGETLAHQVRAPPITPVTSPPPAVIDVTDQNLPVRAVRLVVFGEHAAAIRLMFHHEPSGRFALEPFGEADQSIMGGGMGARASNAPPGFGQQQQQQQQQQLGGTGQSFSPTATAPTQHDPLSGADAMAMDAMAMVGGLLSGVDLSITTATKDVGAATSGSGFDDHGQGYGQMQGQGYGQGYGQMRSAPRAPPRKKGKALVVLDAPNLAMAHGQHKTFSCVGIKIALAYYVQRGHRVVAFLPSFLTDFDSVGKNKRLGNAGYDVRSKCPDDVGMLQDLVSARLVVETPDSDYDDSYCIRYAKQHK